MNIGVELAALVINGAMNTIALKWKKFTFLMQVGKEGEYAFQSAQKAALA
jgi:hypothetical protein